METHFEQSIEAQPIRSAAEDQLEPSPESDQESAFKPIILDRERSLLQRMIDRPRKYLLGLSLTIVTGIAFETARYAASTDQKIKDSITQKFTDSSDDESGPKTQESKSVDETQFPSTFEKMDSLTDAQEQKKQMLEFIHKDLDTMLINIEVWKDLPFAGELLLEIARVNPDLIVVEQDQWRKYFSDLDPMIEVSVLNKPRLLLYDNLDPIIKECVEKSTNPQIQKMQQLLSANFSQAERAKAFGLFSLFDKGTSLTDIENILKDDFAFRRRLIEIVSKPDSDFQRGAHDALADAYSPVIRDMNNLHSSPSQKRFATIQEFNAAELYSLLGVDGAGFGDDLEPMAYPSTYQGVFDRLMLRMKQEKLSGYQLLEQMGHFQSDDFMSMLVQRGRFNDFFGTMNEQEKHAFVKDVFESIDQKTNVKESVGSAAEVLNILLNSKDAQLHALLSRILETKFRNANTRESLVAYGLLSIQMDQNASWIPAETRETLRVQDLSTLEMKDLESKDKDGNAQIIMRHFFPADEDGQSSFSRFIRNIESKTSKWKVVKKAGFYVIASQGSSRKLLMYVNDPFNPIRNEETNADAATIALEEAGFKPTIVFNNGHIYNQVETDGSEEAMRESAAYADMKMFFSGSCGSYARVPTLSAEHPQAQFISTRGTGTQNVNEALKATFYEMFRDPTLTQLQWGDFFASAARKLTGNRDFPKYVQPNNHTFAMVAGKFDALTKNLEVSVQNSAKTNL